MVRDGVGGGGWGLVKGTGMCMYVAHCQNKEKVA